MKSFIILAVMMLAVNFSSTYGRSIEFPTNENVSCVDIQDAPVKAEGKDWIVRGNLLLDDGCKGVYEYQEWVYNEKTCQYEWFSYRMDCLCKDCKCSC